MTGEPIVISTHRGVPLPRASVFSGCGWNEEGFGNCKHFPCNTSPAAYKAGAFAIDFASFDVGVSWRFLTGEKTVPVSTFV